MFNRFFVSRSEYDDLYSDYVVIANDKKKLKKAINKLENELYQKNQELVFYKMVAGYDAKEIIYPNSRDI